MGLFSSLASAVFSWAALQVTAVLLVVIGGLLYYYFTKNYGIYEAKGIPSFGPSLFFGNNKDVFTGKTHMTENVLNFYKKSEGHK